MSQSSLQAAKTGGKDKFARVPRPTFRLSTKKSGGFLEYEINMEHYLEPLAQGSSDYLHNEFNRVLDKRLECLRQTTTEDHLLRAAIKKYGTEDSEDDGAGDAEEAGGDTSEASD